MQSHLWCQNLGTAGICFYKACLCLNLSVTGRMSKNTLLYGHGLIPFERQTWENLVYSFLPICSPNGSQITAQQESNYMLAERVQAPRCTWVGIYTKGRRKVLLIEKWRIPQVSFLFLTPNNHRSVCSSPRNPVTERILSCILSLWVPQTIERTSTWWVLNNQGLRL